MEVKFVPQQRCLVGNTSLELFRFVLSYDELLLAITPSYDSRFPYSLLFPQGRVISLFEH